MCGYKPRGLWAFAAAAREDSDASLSEPGPFFELCQVTRAHSQPGQACTAGTSVYPKPLGVLGFPGG